MIEMRVDFTDVLRNLKQLPDDIAKKMLQSAVNAGANVVRDEARRRAPLGKTGNLRKGIVSKKERTVSPHLSVFSIGWKQGKGGAAHGHLIEYGHRIFVKGPGGKRIPSGRWSQRIPHMTPAFNTTKSQVLDTIRKELGMEKIEEKILKMMIRKPRRKGAKTWKGK